jgi:malonyl-CoA/methylmalonyl-CoA synthetase
MIEHFLYQLRATFAKHAARPALVYGKRIFTYGELDACAENFAVLLQGLRVGPGDRVVLCLAAKLPFLVAHLGVLYTGGVSVPLNPRFTREELRYFLADSGARLAVVENEQRPLLEALQQQLPDLQAVVPEAAVLDARPGRLQEHEAKAEAPCLMVYSSGTSGWPKGVVHTHWNLAFSLFALKECWRFTPDDIVVNVLPLFHIHGLSFATLLAWMSGACVRIEENFHPVGTLDAIGRGTVFMAVPTIYYRFLGQPEFRQAARSWSNVRLFTCGSAPVRPEVLPELQSILNRPIINRYGMTEAHVITSLPLDGPWPNGSVGLPLRGIEVRVMSDAGSQAPANEIGSIQLCGANLFREYWNNPKATQAALVGGWFDTGDLGYLDESGFLTLAGRKSDLIITNGYNVYPQVVERVINDCPGVRESAVLGVPDDMRGERVVAVVVPGDPALNEDRLRAHWDERLVDYQRPFAVLFMGSLPRNAMGKVVRRELRDEIVKAL